MPITLSRHTAICQSVAKVWLTGMPPLGAVFNYTLGIYCFLCIHSLLLYYNYPYYFIKIYFRIEVSEEVWLLLNMFFQKMQDGVKFDRDRLECTVNARLTLGFHGVC